MRLEGKVALITGAASGMGLAMARRFAAEGARVVAGDVNAARLEEAVAGIRAEGGTAVGAPGDIADRAAAEGLVDLALFLASDGARHINGAIIPADGGWTAA